MDSLALQLQQLGASELDTKLAQHEFFNRICLIKTSPDPDFAFTPGRARVDQTISAKKLWPALKFNAFNDLMHQLNKDFGPHGSGRMKAKFTLAAKRLVHAAGLNLGQVGFAYLLGKGDLDYLAVLMKNGNGELNTEGVIFDFHTSIFGMEQGEELCSSAEFQKASKIAMVRLEITVALLQKKIVEVQLTNADSAKKSFQVGSQPQEIERGIMQSSGKMTNDVGASGKMNNDVGVPVDTVEFHYKLTNASDTSSFGVARMKMKTCQ